MGGVTALAALVALGPPDPGAPRKAPDGPAAPEARDPSQPRSPSGSTDPSAPRKPTARDPSAPRAADPSAPRAADPSTPRQRPTADPAAPRAVDPAAPRQPASSPDPSAPRTRHPSSQTGPSDPSAPRKAGQAGQAGADPLDPSAPRRVVAHEGGDEAFDPSAPRQADAIVECPDIKPNTALSDQRKRQLRIAENLFRRRGLSVGLQAGVSGCTGGDWCQGRNYFALGVSDLMGNLVGVFTKESQVGPSFVFELGYRPLRMLEVDGFVEFTYRPQQVNVPDSSDVQQTLALSFSAGVSVLFFPLRYSRFDPYVGLGIGGAQHRARVEFVSGDEIARESSERLTRLLVRPAIGLNIFVLEQLAVGPRVEVDVFAAGRLCEQQSRTDPDGETAEVEDCQAVSDLNDLRSIEGAKGPAGQLPQFWRVTLGAKAYF